jgi:thioredoxin-like negative regulator of GroEL
MSIPMQKFFYQGEAVDEILGAVPEQIIRAKVEDVLHRFPTDEAGRLRVLLASWVAENKKHHERFRQWTNTVEALGRNPLYQNVVTATDKIRQANEALSQALKALQAS